MRLEEVSSQEGHLHFIHKKGWDEEKYLSFDVDYRIILKSNPSHVDFPTRGDVLLSKTGREEEDKWLCIAVMEREDRSVHSLHYTTTGDWKVLVEGLLPRLRFQPKRSGNILNQRLVHCIRINLCLLGSLLANSTLQQKH